MSLEKKPDFSKLETDILKFWDDHNCLEKIKEKNQGKKPFRFLDGPITANNPMGVHHAWGRSIKDIALRYKAMNGHSCHYRNGFDTQGLWVEVEVEKELGFKSKKDIEAYGMDKFTNKCIERIKRFSKVITAQSKRLGQWMDWNNSYFTHTDENISAIWYFLKVCHERGWIRQANRPMPWCPRCGTSLSEHEMSGAHKEVTHKSVFCIAKVKDCSFDVLVWTTTPWTLSANVALAVNPTLDYAIVKCEGFEKPIALAKNAIKYIDGEKQVLKLIKGEELIGHEYETFFPHLSVQKGMDHKIIAWEDVDANEGCGVVHIAPGCGAEDYELGKKYNLPEICPVNESGLFYDEYDFLSGKSAAEASELVFEKLKDQGKLFKVQEYKHSYPVCWRCKTEVIFRLVREWYIQTSEIKPKLIEEAGKVKWEPAFIGKRMNDWLQNMGDWNISRKRFYGLPLPLYPCKKCGHLTVVGSKEELVELGGEVARNLPELHRPWIDEVKIKCPHCGDEVERVPDVGDVWLDAGIVPFSTLGYFSDRAKWEENFPIEWVTEMQEQVRLWFYSLLFMSVTLTGRAPYEKVQAYGKVVAEDGTKFSKTGFMIPFNEAADKIGADAVRYIFAAAPIAGDVRFGYTLGEEARRKLLGFWNICSFFTTYAEIDKPKIKKCNPENPVDRWLNSRVADFINKAKKSYESYNTVGVIKEFETCMDDISNWYVRTNRRRFWKNKLDTDKENAYNSLYYAIKNTIKVMAPIIPFMTEHLWQNIVKSYEPEEAESIHLSDFPEVIPYDKEILKEVEKVRTVITQALKLRNEKNLKVRQPLSKLYLDKMFKDVLPYEDVIKEELNIKNIICLEDFSEIQDEYVKLNFSIAGRKLKGDVNKVKQICENLDAVFQRSLVSEIRDSNTISLPGYDKLIDVDCFSIISKEKENIAVDEDSKLIAINTEITEALKMEGIYREILRNCQLMRKEADCDVCERVTLSFKTESNIIESTLKEYKNDIAREALAKIETITNMPTLEKNISIDGEEAKILLMR